MTLTLEILAGVLALNVVVGGLMLRRGFILIRRENEAELNNAIPLRRPA